jgi:hypothetical protein
LADFVDKVAEAHHREKRCRNRFASSEFGESQFQDLWVKGIAFQYGVRAELRKTFINNIRASAT